MKKTAPSSLLLPAATEISSATLQGKVQKLNLNVLFGTTRPEPITIILIHSCYCQLHWNSRDHFQHRYRTTVTSCSGFTVAQQHRVKNLFCTLKERGLRLAVLSEDNVPGEAEDVNSDLQLHQRPETGEQRTETREQRTENESWFI